MKGGMRFSRRVKQFVATGLLAVTALGLAVLPQAPVAAGALGGAQRFRNQVVLEDGAEVYQVRFRGGELAEVMAEGDGDIDLYIYDEQGRLVAEDDLDDFLPVCRFRPQR